MGELRRLSTGFQNEMKEAFEADDHRIAGPAATSLAARGGRRSLHGRHRRARATREPPRPTADAVRRRRSVARRPAKARPADAKTRG